LRTLPVRSDVVHWTAVVNPIAGRGRTRKILPELEAAFAAHGVKVHVSTDVDDGRRAAQEAVARGDGIVACGGDGTVSALAAVVADADAALAVVPTGAGNDLARELGLDPRRPLDAIAALDDPVMLRIDLGRVTAADGTGAVFTTVANTGFDAEANRWANGVRWATGSTLYVLALLRTLVAYRPRPVTVRVDHEVWQGEAWLVAVGNSRWYAGGMKITPDARVDDGLLDVCIVGDASAFDLLRRFPRVFRGTHAELDQVTMLRGAQVDITSDDERMEMWASGERVGPLPVSLQPWTSSLSVLTPREAHPPRR
jgi:diacylglycerol kinase (ATP)